MIKLTKIHELPEFKIEGYSGSQAPTPKYSMHRVFPDTFQLWFSARDEKNRSHPFFYKILLNSKTDDLMATTGNSEPEWELGNPGEFNDSGNMPSCFPFPESDSGPLLFTGWNKGNDEVKYRLSHGSYDFKSLEMTAGLDRCLQEKIGVSMPFLHDGILYYMSVRAWYKGEAHYDIRSMELDSKPLPKVILSGHACFARPWILDRGSNKPLQLWYCYRDFEGFRDNKVNTYRLGVLEFHNGEWIPQSHRLCYDDNIQKDFMQAYPALINTRQGVYMFYNNGFQSPIQVAKVDIED